MNFREWLELQEASLGGWRGALAGAAMGVASLTGAAKAAPATQPTATTRPTTAPAGNKYIADYIAANEGKRYTVYDDGIGKPTIGIGHYITQDSPALFQRLFGNAAQPILSGQQQMSEAQVQTLFDYDLERHMVRARRMIPAIDSYPVYVKAALVDAFYRGDMGPRTAGLINDGQWREAAKEYLNHKQYKNREALGIRGIGPRMERNRNAMLQYANELERGKVGS